MTGAGRAGFVAGIVGILVVFGFGCAPAPEEHPALPVSTSALGDYNTADVQFAQQMGPHHDQAVEMSKMVLAKNPRLRADVRAVADEIRASQEPEIETINAWLRVWGKASEVDASTSGEGHHGGGGVLSETQMLELDRAAGPSAERLFLDGMIQHHQGAVAMAEAEISHGANPAVIDFARRTAETQAAQITRMQGLRTR